jgi:hypothetical protein
MAASYDFSVVQLAPRDSRAERLNVGILIFRPDGLDIRLARRLEKVRAISAAVDASALRALLQNLAKIDDISRGDSLTNDKRRDILGQISPLSLSALGSFNADRATDYEDRVMSILRALVEPEPAPLRVRHKRSHLLSQVKAVFRQERVLAKKEETLDSHRILQQYELEEGLVADFVLRNGAMHVVETVDASSDEGSPRKALGDIGIASLVLERARMTFGEKETKARLVYEASPYIERVARPSLEAAEHQGTILINWASADERQKFVHSMASLATPTRRKRVREASFVAGNRLI